MTPYFKTLLCIVAVLVLASLMAGCKGTLTEVSVAVPIPCQAVEPQRPVMPTDALRTGASLDQFAQAAMAEIERREGFEQQLVTALRSCTAPLKAAAP